MKNYILVILVFALVMSISGCSNEGVEPVVNEEMMVLNIGAMGSIDVLPLVVAEENGYFEELGLTVNVEMFRAAKDRDAALQAGEIDGVTSDEVAIALYQNANIDMKITGMTDGEFTMVAGKDSGIESVEDLIGKKVAISENTVIEYTVDKIMEKNGFEADEIEKVAIPSMPTRLEMLNNGEVDAALMPSPFSDAAVAAGGVVIDRITNEGQYIAVTAFLNEIIEENPEAIKAFFSAYNKAVAYLNETDVSVYEDLVIRVVGYPETMKGNIVVPVFRLNQLPPESDLNEVLDWANSKGILTQDVSPNDMISNIGVEK